MKDRDETYYHLNMIEHKITCLSNELTTMRQYGKNKDVVYKKKYNKKVMRLNLLKEIEKNYKMLLEVSK